MEHFVNKYPYILSTDNVYENLVVNCKQIVYATSICEFGLYKYIGV